MEAFDAVASDHNAIRPRFSAEYGIRAEAVQPGEETAHHGRRPDPLLPRGVPDAEQVLRIRGRRV